MGKSLAVIPVIDVVFPKLKFKPIDKTCDDGNNPFDMNLYAYIKFLHRSKIDIFLNDALKKYFGLYLNKKIEKITEIRIELLKDMPRITIKGIERDRARSDEPVYCLTDEYLDSWLQPIIYKL